jgi:hypothetical protein
MTSREVHKLTGVPDSEIYRFLYNHYFHNDTLAWSRLPFALTIVTGAIAAAFSFQGMRSYLLLGLGLASVSIILLLNEKDKLDRKRNLELLDTVNLTIGVRFTDEQVPFYRKGSFLGYLSYALLIGLLVFSGVFVEQGPERLSHLTTSSTKSGTSALFVDSDGNIWELQVEAKEWINHGRPPR